MAITNNDDGDEVLAQLFELPEREKVSEDKNHTVPISYDGAREVFDFWVTTFRSSGKGPTPVLSDKRRSKISRAIKDYDVKTCLDAIAGCAMSDWHMGDNPRGKKYDDIELILRDSAHIERFATIFAENGDSASAEFLSSDD